MKESLLTSHSPLSCRYLYPTALLILGLCNIIYLALSRFQMSSPSRSVEDWCGAPLRCQCDLRGLATNAKPFPDHRPAGHPDFRALKFRLPLVPPSHRTLSVFIHSRSTQAAIIPGRNCTAMHFVEVDTRYSFCQLFVVRASFSI